MVQAVINLDEHESRIVNIVKGKFGFRNKSEAIKQIIDYYEESVLEPELKPEYIEKLKQIEKEKTISIGTIDDFKKRYQMK